MLSSNLLILRDRDVSCPPCSSFNETNKIGRINQINHFVNKKDLPPPFFRCQRYTGEKLKDIGAYFGVGESGVSQACKRVKDKISEE